MIQISPLVLLALGELLLLSIVFSLVLLVIGFVRKRNERRAIAKLIPRIKENQARRRAETHTLMRENYGFEGQELDSIVNRISLAESRFYQALINLFFKRDPNLLEVFHLECEGVTEPYRALEIPKPDSVQDNALSHLPAEVEMLKAENERLSTELGVTMDNMGTMLKEYASMYGGGSGADLDKGQLIESFYAFVNDSHRSEPAPVESADSALPGPIGAEVTAPHNMVVERDEVDEPVPDQQGPELFDDPVDFNIREVVEDETLVVDGIEDMLVMNDETLVLNVSDEELVDEDLSMEKTIVDDGRTRTEPDHRQKSAG